MTQNRALILVDIQNDDFTGGLWPVDNMDRAAADLTYGVTVIADACGAKAMTSPFSCQTEQPHDHHR